MTKALARALIADGKTTVVAVHANHPRELPPTPRARPAVASRPRV